MPLSTTESSIAAESIIGSAASRLIFPIKIQSTTVRGAIVPLIEVTPYGALPRKADPAFHLSILAKDIPIRVSRDNYRPL